MANNKIPNSQIIRVKNKAGLKMSDLLKPLWDANISLKLEANKIRKLAWNRKKDK